MGVLNWGAWLPPNFQHTLAAKLHQTFLEVQERAGGPVSPCQVWWGWDLLERLWSYGGFKLVCTPFQYVLAVKIWSDLLEGLWSYGGCKLRGLVAPKFSAHRSGKTMHQTVLEVQERAGGPVSPYQVWWGWDFPAARVAKNVEFFCLSLFISPSRFWTSEFVRPISPWKRWSTETIFMPFVRGQFVVVHPCSTFWDWCQLATSLNAEVQKNSKKRSFSPPEDDRNHRINRLRRNFAGKRIPWVCYSTPSLALIGKRGSVKEPPKMSKCPFLPGSLVLTGLAFLRMLPVL